MKLDNENAFKLIELHLDQEVRLPEYKIFSIYSYNNGTQRKLRFYSPNSNNNKGLSLFLIGRSNTYSLIFTINGSNNKIGVAYLEELVNTDHTLIGLDYELQIPDDRSYLDLVSLINYDCICIFGYAHNPYSYDYGIRVQLLNI